MIVIDTMVHNFLHRIGILARLDASHPYGEACYKPGGCSDIIRTVARGRNPWVAPIQASSRLVIEDTEIGNYFIPKGDTVMTIQPPPTGTRRSSKRR
jgi:hypothetical protein